MLMGCTARRARWRRKTPKYQIYVFSLRVRYMACFSYIDHADEASIQKYVTMCENSHGIAFFCSYTLNFFVDPLGKLRHNLSLTVFISPLTNLVQHSGVYVIHSEDRSFSLFLYAFFHSFRFLHFNNIAVVFGIWFAMVPITQRSFSVNTIISSFISDCFC